MRMFTTTYGVSVSCTAFCENAESIGPMLNGRTYIVRPRIEPRNSDFNLRLISNGFTQLFVGPAASFDS